jgi:hypothetical protein
MALEPYPFGRLMPIQRRTSANYSAFSSPGTCQPRSLEPFPTCSHVGIVNKCTRSFGREPTHHFRVHPFEATPRNLRVARERLNVQLYNMRR